MSAIIRHPFGNLRETVVLDGSEALPEVPITKPFTTISIEADPMSAARTLALDIADNLPFDSQLVLRQKGAAGATRALTLGTGFDAGINTVADGKTDVMRFYFDGSKFVPYGDSIQID